MQENAIVKAYKDVQEFNEVCNNLPDVDYESINLQISICFEEMSEVIESFEELDIVNLAKEVADLQVTVFGLVQKLEAVGVDMGGVLNEVCQNNLQKFLPQGEALQYNSEYTASLNQKHQRWILKNAAGKVMKPSNYQKADVSRFVGNKEFFEEAP